MNPITELLILLLLMIANGLMAMGELAVVSARKTKLFHLASQGNLRARKALDLAKQPDDFLSANEIGLTLIAIVAGAFGGTTLARQLTPELARVAVLKPYSATISFAVIVSLLTYFSVVSELTPKRLALNNPEDIAMRAVGPMSWFLWLTRPAVRLLTGTTNSILKLFPSKSKNEPPTSDTEIEILMRLGTKAGVFEESQQEMVERILSLRERRVGSIMTPRPDVVWLELRASADKIIKTLTDKPGVLYLVADQGPDNIVGAVDASSVWTQWQNEHKIDLRWIMYEPLFVPNTMNALDTLELFQNSSNRVAVVIDEYWVFEGSVTVGDLVQSVLGEVAVHGRKTRWTHRRGRGGWITVDGMMPIDAFKYDLKLDGLPEEDEGLYQTIGGFILSYLERLPEEGDEFEVGGVIFRVMKMSGHRIEKVRVKKQNKQAA